MLRNQSGNSTLILFRCSHFSKGQNVPASDGSKKGIWESNLCPAEGTLFLSQVKRDASALLHILTTSGLYLLQYHIFCILLKYILQSNMTMEGRMKFDKRETWKDEAVDLDSLLSADRVPWIHSSLYNQNDFFLIMTNSDWPWCITTVCSLPGSSKYLWPSLSFSNFEHHTKRLCVFYVYHKEVKRFNGIIITSQTSLPFFY